MIVVTETPPLPLLFVRDVDICLRLSGLTTTAQRATQFIHNERRICISLSSASPSHGLRLKQVDREDGFDANLISQPLTGLHITDVVLRREAASTAQSRCHWRDAHDVVRSPRSSLSSPSSAHRRSCDAQR